jgi:crotonobetainyl-CoA:carnitine CoA-transferase CaiB-like acyl-CoA transferase
MTSLPLSGLRVLELANFMAGPFAGMLLSDQGADVVKVEQPGVGDASRHSPPLVSGEGAGFMSINRGKRSLAINLKAPEGKAAFRRLVAAASECPADVLIENFRPGTMDDLGLGWDALHALNPRLVYCSISGFGQTGPWRERAGLDLIAQATSGLMSVTGEPGGAPVKAGVPAADLTTGLYAAFAVLAALRERERSGLGQYVDLSLFESALSLGIWETSLYFATGEVPGPLGSAHRASAPYQAFRCADGYIVLGATTPNTWTGFCRALGLEALHDDPRFATNVVRKAHEKELAALIEAVTQSRPRAHWLARLDREGVPAGPINRYDEALVADHTQARGMVAEVDHPRAGRQKLVASAVHMSRTPPRRPCPAPLLGQHSREVLREAGLPEGEVEALVAAGVVTEP